MTVLPLAVPQAAPPVSLRPVAAGDEPAVADVFRQVRGEQFAASGLPAEMLTGLLDLQFQAQQAQYRATHPQAYDHVIDVDGRTAGRCYVDRSGSVLRVLDLAVVPALRRHGVGSAVLKALLNEAAVLGTCLHLSVWTDNAAARRLYAGLGFRVQRQQADGLLDLCRPPAGPVVGPCKTDAPDTHDPREADADE